MDIDMKKVYLFFAAAATLFMGVSCDRTDPMLYGGESEKTSFVVLDQDPTYAISEDAGTFKVAVRVVGDHSKKFTVALDVKDGTAIKGTHYSLISPADGQLVFKPKETVKEITFGLTRIPGYVDPGKVDFTLSLASATEGISIGNRRNLTVTIQDADHPLKNFIGFWTAHITDDWGDEYDLNIGVSPDPNDLMTLHFSNLGPYFAGAAPNAAAAVGTASEDLKTVTIDKEQPTGYTYSGTPIVYTGMDDDNTPVDIPVVDNGDDTITLNVPKITVWIQGTTNFYDMYFGPLTLTRK